MELNYTLRQKFSKFFNPFVFMIKHANVSDMHFIGRVLFNFYFNENYARFCYVNGL